MEIEAQAKRRLADEYDAAQQRGEVATRGGERSGREHSPAAPPATDLGLTRKAIHEARQLRDAEAADPGVIRRTLDARLADDQEPTWMIANPLQRGNERLTLLVHIRTFGPGRLSKGTDQIC